MLRQIYDRIILLAGVLIVISIIATALTLWRQREDTIAGVAQSSSNIATILAEQTSHTVQAMDLVLIELVGRAHRRNIHSKEDMGRELNTRTMYNFLKERLGRLPQADVISIVDADGQMVVSTRSWPSPDINVADRDYMQHHKAGLKPSLFVSAPVANKANGATTIFFARRLESADGEFLGVVYIGVRPESFLVVGDAISSVPGQTFVLLRKDGTVFLREPDERNRAGDRLPINSVWHDLVKKDGGIYRSPGVFDDVARWVAVKPVDGYPMVVNVGIREDIALQPGQTRAQYIVAGLVAALAALGFIANRLLHQFRKAIASDAKLRDRECSLIHLAHHDALTGLGNRALFLTQVEKLIDALAHGGPPFAVMLIDLDRFKQINDSYGHVIGDEVLRVLARAIRSACGPDDLAVRLGGDEFAVVRPLRDEVNDWAPLAERIRVDACQPFMLDGHCMSVTLSIGVALAGAGAETSGEVMRNADLALYKAKADGQNCYRVFDPQMQELSLTQLGLAVDLRETLRAGKLELHYQPIFDTRTRKVCAVEALARWNHPTKGPISPGVFIPLAEKFGLVIELGEFVIARACRDAAQWPDHVRIAINISAIHVANDNLITVVRAALARTKLDPARLEIEITESAIMKDAEHSLAKLRQLRELGISIVLDDFGTGFSSLSYLSRFPLDKVKIDKSFVDNIGKDGGSTAIIAATISIARALNITTTAEGVESEDQLTLLRAAGADEAQGFLLARPQPFEKLDFARLDAGAQREAVAA